MIQVLNHKVGILKDAKNDQIDHDEGGQDPFGRGRILLILCLFNAQAALPVEKN